MQNLNEQMESLLGEQVLSILNAGKDSIVLLEPGKAYPVRRDNLLRLRTDGSVVWRVNPPSSTDSFTKADWDGDKLVAWSWEGYLHSLDPITGKILDSIFTK